MTRIDTPAAALLTALELAGAELAIVRGRIRVQPGPDPLPPRLLQALERYELAVLAELRRHEDEATADGPVDPGEDLRRLLELIGRARRWLELVAPHAGDYAGSVIRATARALDLRTNPRLAAVARRIYNTPSSPTAGRIFRGRRERTRPNDGIRHDSDSS